MNGALTAGKGERWSSGAVEQFPCNLRNATAV